MSTSSVEISCLCGGIAQVVEARGDDADPLSLCHCDTCRHTSGLLCTSYLPIEIPDALGGTRRYVSSDGSVRHFCSTCGCHAFRQKGSKWEVATGVVKDNGTLPLSNHRRHVGVDDTKDGGLSVWLPTIEGREVETDAKLELASTQGEDASSNMTTALAASCDCGAVSFQITRPDETSARPHRNFADLIYAYKDTPESIFSNPSDEKWWLRANRTKYLAGTCACNSCRLASGFEMQVWAFVPRSNIMVGKTAVPLDFSSLPEGVLLQRYRSSPGVAREFCGGCGATVFWHDEELQDVVDVSVGLLRADEGARAETWLAWWADRVSFAEDGDGARRGLITALGEGMKMGRRC